MGKLVSASRPVLASVLPPPMVGPFSHRPRRSAVVDRLRGGWVGSSTATRTRPRSALLCRARWQRQRTRRDTTPGGHSNGSSGITDRVEEGPMARGLGGKYGMDQGGNPARGTFSSTQPVSPLSAAPMSPRAGVGPMASVSGAPTTGMGDAASSMRTAASPTYGALSAGAVTSSNRFL